jgi:predicted component of type VI protein secretion system
MEAKLVPVDGGEPIYIHRDVTVVGRGRSLCDVVLDDSSISKLQCLIAKTDGLLFIRDLGSTNGTKVNGQKITRGALLPGDELAFASLKFRVYLGPSRDLASSGVGEQTALLDAPSEAPLGEEDYEDVEPQHDGEPEGSRSDVRLISEDSALGD